MCLYDRKLIVELLKESGAREVRDGLSYDFKLGC